MAMGKMAVNKRVIALFLALTVLASIVPFSRQVKASRTIIVPNEYPTIQQAIEVAGAGDTIYVRKGHYEGPFNQTVEINKAINLLGEDKNTTTLRLSPPYVKMNIFTYEYMGYLAAINISSSNVRVSGITIDAPGGGITGKGGHIQITGVTSTTGFSIEGSHTTISENELKGDLAIVGNSSLVKNNRFKTDALRPSASCVGSNNIFSNNSLINENETLTIKLDIGGSNNFVANSLLATIHLRGNDNIIYKNHIKAVPGDAGVYLIHSSRNVICGNRITYAESATYDQDGIFLSESNDNKIYANHMESLFKGAYLQNSDYEPMTTNNNTFYDNNFINNKIQAWDTTSSTTNNFDNGKEGNYWSDYNGTDLNNDGIGDTSFSPIYVYTYDHLVEKITKCNQDNFPLMTPFNVENVTIDLPEWVSTSLNPSPNISPTLTPSPYQSSSLSPTFSQAQEPSSSLSPPNSPTYQPTQEPTWSPPISTEYPPPPQFPFEGLVPLITIAVVVASVAVAVGLRFYFRRTQKQKLGQTKGSSGWFGLFVVQ